MLLDPLSAIILLRLFIVDRLIPPFDFDWHQMTLQYFMRMFGLFVFPLYTITSKSV